jgi:hypothetical protein
MKLTLEQLQELLKDRQDQFRVYQQKADRVRQDIDAITEQINAAMAQQS